MQEVQKKLDEKLVEQAYNDKEESKKNETFETHSVINMDIVPTPQEIKEHYEKISHTNTFS